MRLAVAVVLVLSAACGANAKTSGPAWPKMTVKEKDGGESIAPRAKAASVAAASDDDEDVVATKPADKPADAKPEAKAGDAKPAEAKPTAPEGEITITTEEIVIEIDD